MTSKASWRTLLTLMIALALLAAPVALAQEEAPETEDEEDEHPSERGKDRAEKGRANGGGNGDDNETLEAADNETADNETDRDDNETEDEDDGPPAHVLERREQRGNGTWVPPGLLVALENVPDAVKARIRGLIDAWESGMHGSRGGHDDADTNETATDTEDVTVVEDDSDANETAKAKGGRSGERPAQAQGHGPANALDRVPDFVRAKLTAFWSIFA